MKMRRAMLPPYLSSIPRVRQDARDHPLTNTMSEGAATTSDEPPDHANFRLYRPLVSKRTTSVTNTRIPGLGAGRVVIDHMLSAQDLHTSPTRGGQSLTQTPAQTLSPTSVTTNLA